MTAPSRSGAGSAQPPPARPRCMLPARPHTGANGPAPVRHLRRKT
ncbi:MAG: hypothetical protein PHT99_08760 [Methanoregula sp.]|nr:hypothetical protein [Methanoregula sp.]